MTTIIMISHNSSVIINHSGEDEGGGEEEEDEKKMVTDKVTHYDRHNSNGMTFPISSSTSQSSSTTSTPDASFITPRPLSKTSHNDNLHRNGRSPHRRRLKNSLSTLESDSEDMNTTTEGSSGGSAASTLSSAAYILSSVTYFPSLPEETYGRVTIGSDATNLDHSFSCAVTSTPAHHNNNNNNEPGSVRSPLNGPHGLKFYVDPSSGRIDLKTPSECVVAGSLDRRRANQKFPSSVHQPRSMSVSQMSAFATPATINNNSSTYKRLLPSSVSSYCTLTRNKGQRLLPDESVLRSGGVFKVPSSHLSASSIGPAVTCHSSGISTGSVSSRSSENRSESEKRKTRSRKEKEEQRNVSRQFDRSRRGSFKSYSQWRSSSVKIRVKSVQSEEEVRKRRPLSELMSIKGSHEDIEDVVDQFLDQKELEKSSAISSSCSSIASSESSSKFRPIGAAVLPTGWHRHPHHNHQHHSLPMRRCQSVDEEDEDQEEVRKKKCQRNLFGANSENEKEEDCWFLDGNFVSLQLNDNEDNVGDGNDDDCDDIQSWLSRDNVTGSTIFETSHNNKSSRDSSRRGLKFVPSSVLNSRILRRHTTYIKSMDNVMASLMTSQSEKSPENCDQTNHQRPPHVHSWHKRGPKWEDLNNNNNNNKKRQQVGTYETINQVYKFFSATVLSRKCFIFWQKYNNVFVTLGPRCFAC